MSGITKCHILNPKTHVILEILTNYHKTPNQCSISQIRNTESIIHGLKSLTHVEKKPRLRHYRIIDQNYALVNVNSQGLPHGQPRGF